MDRDLIWKSTTLRIVQTKHCLVKMKEGSFAGSPFQPHSANTKFPTA